MWLSINYPVLPDHNRIKWKDGIGPKVSHKGNPNTIWGGYSDYYGFGTDEFMELYR
jgi:alpha-N-arabinofuranosidase